MKLEDRIMRHHTAVSRVRHNGHLNGLSKKLDSLTTKADRIKGKTSRILAKSLRNVKSKARHLPKDLDRMVVNNRYQTIGAAMVAGLCIGYFIKK